MELQLIVFCFYFTSPSCLARLCKVQCGIVRLIYDIFVNCNWVVTRWQKYYTFTHKQYIEGYETNNT